MRRAFDIARAVALAGGLLVPAGAGAQCPLSSLENHVVLLEFTNPNAGTGAEAFHKTGVLVSDTGLVLTSFSLIGDAGVGPQELLNFSSDDALEVRAWAKRYPSGDEAEGVVIGHDWRRDLLLVKLPESRVAELGLRSIPLAREPVSRSDVVCLAGFQQENQGFVAEPAETTFAVRPGDQVTWKVPDYRLYSPEFGTAVIDSVQGTLLGIVVGYDGRDSLFLPIEFADTLLSQVFISRIMNDLRRIEEDLTGIESFSRKIQSGVAWNYRMLEEPDGQRNALRIRFYFDPILEDTLLRRIEISTSLWGTTNGLPDQSVRLDTYRQTPSVGAGNNYIDYDAYDYIEAARNQGFDTIDRIQLRLRPIFDRGPQGTGPQDPAPPRFTTFEFPLTMQLGG